MLSSQFKENVKKMKPIYEEIVKLAPSLIENLQNSIQKQNAWNQKSSSGAPQNENNRQNQGSFISQHSNPSFNSSNFSISSSTQESIESIMKSILSLAQSIKSQIREIESQTSNLEEFNEHLTKFKNNKVAFFNCIGAIEIYWMLRFDNISVFFQQEIKQLQKGMDLFLTKLKQIIQKQAVENADLVLKQKKFSYESHQQNDKLDASRQQSITATHQENMSDGASSYTSQELYYTAKSFQIPRYKISEQIALQEIPEEDLGKQSCTYTQSNFDNPMFQYQSQQSDLESKYENEHQYNTNSQTQNEKFSFSSNFQFVTKPYENQESQFKSILSNSDNPKDSQIKISQQENLPRSILGQTQSFQNSRDQRDFSKSIGFNSQDKKENNIDVYQSNSQQTASTRSQANPSGQSESNNGTTTWNNDKKEIQKKSPNDKYITSGYCFCISRVV